MPEKSAVLGVLESISVRTQLSLAFGGLGMPVLLVLGLPFQSLAQADERIVDYVKGVNACLAQALPKRTEPGSSICGFHHDPYTPVRFALWERFENEAARQQHLEEPHMQSYLTVNLSAVMERPVTDEM